MPNTRWAIFLVLGLSACASAEELAVLDDRRCVEEFGFEPRSDDYDRCRSAFKARRDQLWRSNL